ncbi:2251_t:CDS:2 [Acaulospora morrowiae]|uniref:2251_t:CDS:1 n=1 Tax=Acaulospora morrowiae TaxID=94023 RepID=A0A9N9ARJ8_9GLOM|nr:2251_t:CDS:2 [Acaulospora morrowiae]
MWILTRSSISHLLVLMGFLAQFAWGFPALNPPGFRSIIVQSPAEAECFKIGSTHLIRWKSTLPPDTEVVIEILASPRYELEPPEMVWRTTAVSISHFLITNYE